MRFPIPDMARWRKWRRTIGALISAAVFLLALYVLYRAAENYEMADIAARLAETPWWAILLASLAAAGSYLVLGGFDWLAVRHIGRPIPVGRVFFTSFVSHGISHSAGFAALTGGGVRYRIYSAAGVGAAEVAGIVVFCGLTFVLGATLLAALALVFEPERFAEPLGLRPGTVRVAGLGMAAVMAAYVLLSALLRRPARIFGRRFRIPGPRMTLAQTTFAAVDLALAAAVLYVLLPAGPGPSYPAIIGIYVLANVAGIAFHIPGGLGVFEGAVILLVPDLPADAVLGALLLYRVIYNLIPLVLGVALLGAFEGVERFRFMRRATEPFRTWLREVEPAAVAIAVFAGGALVLLTGVAPADPLRLAVLAAHVPVAVVEVAHAASSAVAVMLLLLARGVHRRLVAAHVGATLLLAAGAASVLLRGFDYEEALILLAVMALLVVSRRGFYRGTPVAVLGLSPGWATAAATVVVAALWLLLFIVKDIPGPMALLTDFAADAERPRAMRGLIVAVTTLLVAGLLLLRHGARPPAPAEPATVAAILRRAEAVQANAVWLPEARALCAPSGDAMVVWRDCGSYRIALGDPVGRPEAWPDLAWRFRELCESEGRIAAFAGVARRSLYLDLGLAFLPLADEGRVNLATFSLRHDILRDIRARREASIAGGVGFEVLAPSRAAAAVGEAAEAVGRIMTGSGRFRLAVLRRDNRIVAAAALWEGANHREAALAGPAVACGEPAETAEHLLVEGIMRARRHGYAQFVLGGIPLPVALDKTVARLWRCYAESTPAAFPAGVEDGEGVRRRLSPYRPRWGRRFLAIPADAAMPRLALEMTAPFPATGTMLSAGSPTPAADGSRPARST